MEKDCTVKVERPVYEQQELQRTCGYTQPKTTLCDGVKRNCAAFKPGQFLLDRIPVLRWLPQYKWREDLVSDLISGATVAIMHIPQGMAYALLGNVPPIVGIYMAFFPVLVYFFLGTSRHVSMGTFAVICLMTGKTVVTYSSPDSVILKTVGNSTEHYSPVEVATAVAFMVGIFQLGMYVFQFGIVSMLLSDTLVNGFTTGAAIHVLTSQIKDLLGLEVTRFKGPFKLVYTYIDIFNKILEANTAAIVISAVSIIALVINNEALKPWISKKSVLPVPIELILVITGTLVSQYMNLPDDYGVSTVGSIPVGLPNPTLPELSLLPYVALDSFTITMVAYTIAMSMALIFAQKKNYEVDSNQELLAQGAGNVVGSFFSCMPFTASLSRSLIQVTVGGKTQLASIVSCTLLLFVLLWIGPFFEPLPRSVLASIIIVALKGMLLQVTSLPKFWQLSTLDGIVWVATFLTVVFVDIDYGLLVGIVLSLASIFIQGMKAYVCLLEPWPGTDLYLDTTRYKKTREVPGIKIFHYCGALNFASRNNFKLELYRLVGINAQQELLRRQKRNRQLENMKEESKEGFINISFDEQNDADSEVNCIPEGIKSQDATYGSISHQVRYIILDLSALSYVDPTGVATLRALAEQYSKIDIPLYIAGISGPVYEKLQKCGLFADEQTNIKSFPTVHDAVLFTQSLMNQYSGVHL